MTLESIAASKAVLITPPPPPPPRTASAWICAWVSLCMCICVRAYVRACVRVCTRVRVRSCVCVCMCIHAYSRAYALNCNCVCLSLRSFLSSVPREERCRGIFCDLPVCPPGSRIDYTTEACCPGCSLGNYNTSCIACCLCQTLKLSWQHFWYIFSAVSCDGENS